MNAIILAAILSLVPGENAAPASYGQVLAVEATTQSASATVKVSAVSLAQTWTNTYQDVTTAHRRYDFVVTNWDGNASVSTNVLDSFSYADWRLGGITNMIVGAVRPSNTNITTTVATGKALAASYLVTNDLASVSVDSHYGIEIPDTTTYFFGGDLIVSGTSDGDTVKLLLK